MSRIQKTRHFMREKSNHMITLKEVLIAVASAVVVVATGYISLVGLIIATSM